MKDQEIFNSGGGGASAAVFDAVPPTGSRKTILPPKRRGSEDEFGPDMEGENQVAPAANGAPPQAGAAGDDDQRIKLGLKAVLERVPDNALGFDPEQIPDSVQVELPMGLIKPQLSTGRVSVPLHKIIDGCEERVRPAFSRSNGAETVNIPLQEIFHNLPTGAFAPPRPAEGAAPAAPAGSPVAKFETPFSIHGSGGEGASSLPASPFESAAPAQMPMPMPPPLRPRQDADAGAPTGNAHTAPPVSPFSMEGKLPSPSGSQAQAPAANSAPVPPPASPLGAGGQPSPFSPFAANSGVDLPLPDVLTSSPASPFKAATDQASPPQKQSQEVPLENARQEELPKSQAPVPEPIAKPVQETPAHPPIPASEGALPNHSGRDEAPSPFGSPFSQFAKPEGPPSFLEAANVRPPQFGESDQESEPQASAEYSADQSREDEPVRAKPFTLESIADLLAKNAQRGENPVVSPFQALPDQPVVSPFAMPAGEAMAAGAPIPPPPTPSGQPRERPLEQPKPVAESKPEIPEPAPEPPQAEVTPVEDERAMPVGLTEAPAPMPAPVSSPSEAGLPVAMPPLGSPPFAEVERSAPAPVSPFAMPEGTPPMPMRFPEPASSPAELAPESRAAVPPAAAIPEPSPLPVAKNPEREDVQPAAPEPAPVRPANTLPPAPFGSMFVGEQQQSPFAAAPKRETPPATSAVGGPMPAVAEAPKPPAIPEPEPEFAQAVEAVLSEPPPHHHYLQQPEVPAPEPIPAAAANPEPEPEDEPSAPVEAGAETVPVPSGNSGAEAASSDADSPAENASAAPEVAEHRAPTPEAVPPPAAAPSPTKQVSAGPFNFDFGEQIKQVELRAIFGVSEDLDAARVLDLASGLPGVDACVALKGGSVCRGGRPAEGDNAQYFCENAAGIHSRVSGLAADFGIECPETFGIQTARGKMTFFSSHGTILGVLHSGDFGPGIREKLHVCARGLGEILA
ncbi:MAG: hypothetical protein R3F11_18560 [Verrucomicrobiales bacterium]